MDEIAKWFADDYNSDDDSNHESVPLMKRSFWQRFSNPMMASFSVLKDATRGY